MKALKLFLLSGVALILFNCGRNKEDTEKLIEKSTSDRAASFCNDTSMYFGEPLDNYEMALSALSAGLKDQGVSDEDFKKAIDLFDKKVKESCPEKVPN